MNKYGDVTFLSDAEFNSPSAQILGSSGVFAVGGDMTVLYVSNGKALVAASGDPAPRLVGALVPGGTLYVTMAPNWSASSMQVNRNGVPINGAIGPSYDLQDLDLVPGTVLTVDVSGFSHRSFGRVAPGRVPTPGVISFNSQRAGDAAIFA